MSDYSTAIHEASHRNKARGDYLISLCRFEGGKVMCPSPEAQEEFDRRLDLSTAYHEAGHAIIWWQRGGAHIDEMTYCTEEQKRNGRNAEASTITSADPEFVAANRVEYAKSCALSPLSAITAQDLLGEDFLPKGLREHLRAVHIGEAREALKEVGAESEFDGLMDCTARMFRTPVAVRCVETLGAVFQRCRKLSGKEVFDILNGCL